MPRWTALGHSPRTPPPHTAPLLSRGRSRLLRCSRRDMPLCGHCPQTQRPAFRRPSWRVSNVAALVRGLVVLVVFLFVLEHFFLLLFFLFLHFLLLALQ